MKLYFIFETKNGTNGRFTTIILIFLLQKVAINTCIISHYKCESVKYFVYMHSTWEFQEITVVIKDSLALFSVNVFLNYICILKKRNENLSGYNKHLTL